MAAESNNNDNSNEVTKDETFDSEGQEKKLPYPKAIAFIIGNEFCERFTYYGMRTILVIYLTRMLLYSQDTATVIYHVFTMSVYLFCVVGAFISDSWLGKFNTILYLSIIYVIGSVVVSLGSIEPLGLPDVAMTMLGLALIAFGSGGIKPCVAAFGGDQFKLPQQAAQVATFFSIFYFAINSGSVISTAVTPILRQDVHCFDNEHCFPIAFGIPAVLMIISIIVFVIGRPLYVSRPPEGNTFVLVIKVICNGIAKKFKNRKTDPREHFLDYSKDKFGAQIVADVKVLLRVLVLYIPVPLFWALFDQQGSRWTFQAMMMDGDMGAISIKPEQMQLANSLFILIFIPCYEYLFYPLLAKIGVTRPLQKLTIGGLLAGAAFILSAALELAIEPTYGIQPSPGISQMRVFNGIPGCDYSIKTDLPKHEEFILKSLDYFEELDIDVSKTTKFKFSLTSSSLDCVAFDSEIELEDNAAISFWIKGTPAEPSVLRYHDETEKSEQGFSIVRVLANIKEPVNIYFKPQLSKVIDVNGTNLVGLQTSTYDLMFEDTIIWSFWAQAGDVITVVVTDKGSSNNPDYAFETYRLAPANSVKVFWQIPQYFVLTLGEVMFSVTGLEFSYAQAPLSMKAVLQACWQLAIAIGNLVMIIITEIKIFESRANEYFLFAGLMTIDMGLFAFLAVRYKSNDPNKRAEDESERESVREESGKKGIINPTFHED